MTASVWKSCFLGNFVEPTWSRVGSGQRLGNLPHWPLMFISEIVAWFMLWKCTRWRHAVFKSDPEWWAPVLAKLFTSISSISLFPWGLISSIYSLWKKRKGLNPKNDSQVSVLIIALEREECNQHGHSFSEIMEMQTTGSHWYPFLFTLYSKCPTEQITTNGISVFRVDIVSLGHMGEK